MPVLTKLILGILLVFQLPEPKASEVTHRGEIWPHPRDPEHLQKVLVGISATQQKGFLWLKREVPEKGKISIQEARTRGGWWVSAVRELDIDGNWSGEVMLDPTLRKDNIVLFILFDDYNNQVGHCEIHAGDLSHGVFGKILVKQ